MEDALVYLEAQITPGARRNEVVGWHDGRLKLKIKAPPVEGKANAEVCRFVAELLGLRPADVSISLGEKSKQKKLAVRRISGEEMRERLSKL